MTGPLDIDAGDWEAEVNQSKTPVLVDFWHEGCVWCKHLDPVYNELAVEFSGQLKFAKLNVLSSEENNRVAARFGVMSTPTLILFCDGEPIMSFVGFRPKEALKSELKRIVETDQDCFKQHTPLRKQGG